MNDNERKNAIEMIERQLEAIEDDCCGDLISDIAMAIVDGAINGISFHGPVSE